MAHVVVVNHADLYDVKMTPNRDIWWHDLIEDFTLDVDFPCEPMDANDTLIPAAAPASLRASCTPRAAT